MVARGDDAVNGLVVGGQATVDSTALGAAAMVVLRCFHCGGEASSSHCSLQNSLVAEGLICEFTVPL